MSKYPYGSFITNAIYSEPLQPLQKGNPLIEALPENQSSEAWYRSLVSTIPYNAEEQKFPSYERIECIGALYNCFQPWSTHIKIAEQLSRSIKSGYVARSPLSSQRIKERQQLYNCVREKDSEFTGYNLSNATASGFSIIGYSGMGKTSAINHVLSLYPQFISHSKYKEESFPHSQIVWMKLECPFDGSVKGLCSSFFIEFDRITGDNTYQKHAARARVTTDQMIPQIAILAHRHSLGALIIDEIQNISAAKSGGIQKMLNFIVHLMNTIGVPVILLGTPEAIEILSKNLMTARRNSGQYGTVIMNNLKKESEDWKIFVKGIWKYQWLKDKTLLTQELMDTLNDESFGIVDVAIKLFASAQIRAIQHSDNSKISGTEVITPKLIRNIANSDDFKLLKKRLTMLQNPNKASLTDSDMSLIRWDLLRKEIDLREVLPIRPVAAQASTERNEELQQSVSIPKKQTTSDKTILETVSAPDTGDTAAKKLKAAGMIVSPDDEF